MLFTIISMLLFVLTAITCYKEYKKRPNLLKKVYFNNHIDWFLGLGLVVVAFLIIIPLYMVDVSWLKWSLFSLFTSDQSGTNVVTASIWTTGSVVFSTIVYLVFLLILPIAAFLEEMSFRSLKFGVKSRIISSFQFGFIHMLVGVPVLAAISLSVIGYFYSIRYIKKLKQTGDLDEAIMASTSLHTKYNFFVITLMFLLFLLN